jgi:hypothetical protein
MKKLEFEITESDREREFCENELTKIENYELVPHKMSVELQSLGFNHISPIHYYEKNGIVNYESDDWLNNKFWIAFNAEILEEGGIEIFCSAPLYQQVFRWFREEHNLHGCIDLSVTKPEHWYFRIDRIGSNDYEYHSEDEQIELNTYQEGQNACIQKMIELLQHQPKTVA